MNRCTNSQLRGYIHKGGRILGRRVTNDAANLSSIIKKVPSWRLLCPALLGITSHVSSQNCQGFREQTAAVERTDCSENETSSFCSLPLLFWNRTSSQEACNDILSLAKEIQPVACSECKHCVQAFELGGPSD